MTIKTQKLALSTLLSSALMLGGTAALAQDAGFSWEGELEIGNESVFDSNVAGNEISNTYLELSLGAAYRWDNGVEVFTALKAESLTDPVADRAFEDIGLYVEELGLSFPAGAATTISLGKLAPSFGSAWDDTSGFFGDALAGDYELVEQIGILADVEALPGGVLSLGVFYADDTALSRSVGYERGRNTTAAGGAGNTGELNNVSLQWRHDLGDGFYQVAARKLSAGQGDVDDETGLLLGGGYTFGEAFVLFGEVAQFNNFGGGAEDASYATLSGAYYIGPSLSLSGTLSTRDLSVSGRTDMASLGAEYEFASGITVGGALAMFDDAGTKDRVVGLNVIIPFGG